MGELGLVHSGSNGRGKLDNNGNRTNLVLGEKHAPRAKQRQHQDTHSSKTSKRVVISRPDG